MRFRRSRSITLESWEMRSAGSVGVLVPPRFAPGVPTDGRCGSGPVVEQTERSGTEAPVSSFLAGVAFVRGVAGPLEASAVPVADGSRAWRNVDDVTPPALGALVVRHGLLS